MARTTGSDELYKLIHSLTVAEKGYFKKFALRHTSDGNKYLQLYKALDKMESYNETLLKKDFKNLASLKNYLFDLILDSLYHSETAPAAANQILKGIVNINLLIKKGLRGKALKLLAEYKKTAEEAEFYHLLAYLMKIEFNITRMQWTPKDQLGKTKTAAQAIRKMNEIQMNADDFLNQHLIGYSLCILERNTGIKSDPEKWMDLDFINSPQKALSPLAEGYRLSALSDYYDLKDSDAELHDINRQLYEFEKKKWLQSNGNKRPEFYLNALNTYIATCLEKKDIALAEKLVEDLRAVPLKEQNVILENDLRYTYYRQNILWANGEHITGEAFSKEALMKLKKVYQMPQYYSKLIKLVGKQVMFEFSNQHYREALNSLVFFNPTSVVHYSEENKKAAELTQLLIQFEIGNLELIKGFVRSIKNRVKSFTKEEQHFLIAFQKYHHTPKELYEYLHTRCPSIFLLHTLHLADWIESKLTNKPLSKVVRQNLR